MWPISRPCRWRTAASGPASRSRVPVELGPVLQLMDIFILRTSCGDYTTYSPQPPINHRISMRRIGPLIAAKRVARHHIVYWKYRQNSVQDSIRIRGARVHNLKNISLSIPHNQLTVVTGVSGSGKSSLAFDTIYAEGPAALCGIALGLRAPVPGAHGEARRGRDRRHRAGRRHPAEEHDAQSALDGRHVHRVLRFPAPAVRARRADLLPELRHARAQGHGGSSGGAHARAAGGLALVRAVSRAASTPIDRGAARPPVRAAQEGLQPPVPGRPAVRILDARIAARYRFRASRCSCWWTASRSRRICISAWSTPSRSAIANRAK